MKKVSARIWHGVVVALTICAWFAISNHCAIGTTLPEAKPEASACPFHAKKSTPAKQKQSSDSPCCKILRATIAAKTKKIAPAIVDLAPADLLFTELIVFAPPKISFGFETLDTGPPGKTSFVELSASSLLRAPPLVG
jgi:hypothetical protein